MISLELSKSLKIEWLESLSVSDLAFWLIHSFSPARYHDENDVIKEACSMLKQQSSDSELVDKLILRLWGMHNV